MQPRIPQTIGRYDIVELVGRGGMGVLYRARDPVLERDVALKMMLVDFSLDQTARERFEREAKAVARLQHRNVVTIHELGETDGTPYIVMEFLGGRDLEAIMRSGKPLTLIEKLDIVTQLCEGLAYAHEQGIVHRDIKPGNVRVLEDGTVKILDFGIAKFAMSSMTQSGTILGTASYMAPEQILGQPVDGRADLFSVGVLLHELVSGRKPFGGDSATAVVYQIMHVEPLPVRDTVPDLPDALNDIVSRALKKNPDERYSRASELASDLQLVKMMLDMPLHPGDAPAIGATAVMTSKLYATSISTKTGFTPAGQVTVGPATGVATEAGARPRSRVALIAAAAALVAVASVGAFIALRGREASNTPSTGSAPTGAANPGPKDTPASSLRSGAGAAAPAASDLLVLSSVPAGARIVLNGTDTGKVTPAAVSLGGQLPSTVELSLKGYQPFAANLTDADVKAGKREFRLAREAGPVRLSISGAFPFEVLQGSRVLSPAATRHEVTVQPGGGGVTVRSPEYLLHAPVAIDFQRAQVDVTLPAPGALAVFSAVETCSVIVDGIDLGFPPIPRKSVASGAHTVTLKCRDGKEESRKVTVTAGDRMAVTFGPPKFW